MEGSENEVLLMFDIGNTRIKWAFAHNKTILVKDAFIFSDEGLQDCVRHVDLLLKRFGLEGLTKISISSVASTKVLTGVQDSITEKWGITPNTVEVESSFETITNHYEGLGQLGVDRWVAVVGAAFCEHPGAKIVVDVGTAVTVDYLSSDNEYLGGAILPGRDLMLSLLNLNTANIRAQAADFKTVFGRTTSECVNVGSHTGLNGAVAAIIERMVDERPEPTNVMLCGGGAESVGAYLRGIQHQDLITVESEPDLIFLGLIALS